MYRLDGFLARLPDGGFRGWNLTDSFLDPKSPVGRQCELVLALISGQVQSGALKAEEVSFASETAESALVEQRMEILPQRFPALRGAFFAATPPGFVRMWSTFLKKADPYLTRRMNPCYKPRLSAIEQPRPPHPGPLREGFKDEAALPGERRTRPFS